MTVAPAFSSIPPVLFFASSAGKRASSRWHRIRSGTFRKPKGAEHERISRIIGRGHRQPRNVPTITQPDARPLLRVRSAGLTDPGKVREGNEDQFFIAQLLKAWR